MLVGPFCRRLAADHCAAKRISILPFVSDEYGCLGVQGQFAVAQGHSKILVSAWICESISLHFNPGWPDCPRIPFKFLQRPTHAWHGDFESGLYCQEFRINPGCSVKDVGTWAGSLSIMIWYVSETADMHGV